MCVTRCLKTHDQKEKEMQEERKKERKRCNVL